MTEFTDFEGSQRVNADDVCPICRGVGGAISSGYEVDSSEPCHSGPYFAYEVPECKTDTEMLKSLLDMVGDMVGADGPNQHLVNALNEMVAGDQERATLEVAAILVVEKALNGPLDWISHPEYVQGENVKVTDKNVTGEAHYRNEMHKVEIILGGS